MAVRRAGKLNGLQPRLENAVKRGLIQSGMLVAQRATRWAPRDTGRLKRSLTHDRPEQVGPAAWRVDVGTNVEYARAQEFGSGIHAERGSRQRIPIVARRARALAFNWPDAPAEVRATQKKFPLVFFKRVMHPGVRPQPYLRPALAESGREIRALLLKNIIAAFR